ncbi:MAG TPA: hypothetical protein VMB21_10140 [Candidatus Limnocylindria bacterium]|nr:hypothetical protein [Candidatus Limnocylindria bacterium]
MRSALLLSSFLGLLLFGTFRAGAQIDPERRQLIQFGYNQPLEGRGPIAGYAYYYRNEPGFIYTNLTLRLALAPTYLDTELGVRGLLGENTDVGFGLAGGGFADSYSEVRGGKLWNEESFSGDGAEGSISLYHLFNPLPAGQTNYSGIGDVPLQLVFRSAARYSLYQRDDETSAAFKLPEDKLAYHLRLGLRWGGREPLLFPDRAVELSLWYEGQFRTDSQAYGYNDDRDVQAQSHLFWSRALVAWELPRSQRIEVTLTGGVSLHADRFSAYRLGGALPLNSEFPLMVPGYYFQELSAKRFILLNSYYSVPFTPSKRWDLSVNSGIANVDFLPGLEEPDHWHYGIGGGVGYTSGNGAWHWMLGYAYGVNAIRDGHHGAHSIGIVMEYDLESGGMAPVRRAVQHLNPNTWRGFDHLFGR